MTFHDKNVEFPWPINMMFFSLMKLISKLRIQGFYQSLLSFYSVREVNIISCNWGWKFLWYYMACPKKIFYFLGQTLWLCISDRLNSVHFLIIHTHEGDISEESWWQEERQEVIERDDTQTLNRNCESGQREATKTLWPDLETVEQPRVWFPAWRTGGVGVNVLLRQLDVLVTADALLTHWQGLVGFAVFHLPVTQGRSTCHSNTASGTDWGGREQEINGKE